MAAIGIVVNPVAAHDVRRLTSLARTVDVHERVNAVARVLGGLAAPVATRPAPRGSSRQLRTSRRPVGSCSPALIRPRNSILPA